MFAIFVLKKDKSGVEYCARQGRAVTSKEKALASLKHSRRGVVLDIGEFNPKGLSNLDTFLRHGAKPVASVGMDGLGAALMLQAA